MKHSIFTIDSKSICLAVIALAINMVFFAANYHNDYYLGLLLPHGEIGYNFAVHGSIKLNKERCDHIRALERARGRMVDHAEIDHAAFGLPTNYIGPFDTPGYGIILGLLWSCTRSFCYHDIQIAQILLFSLLMFLIYGLALFLFQNVRTAFVIGLCHLSFLPIMYQNVQALRDIWAYYALVVLLWSLAAYYKRVISLPFFAGGIALFSCLELIRPSSLYSFIIAVLFCMGAGFLQKNERSCWWKAAGVMVCTNALFFWTPYVTYNQIAYGRSIVSSWGLLLLEGLGERENQWGFQLNDEWAGKYLKAKYNVSYGTVAFADKAKEEFFKALKENPSHFIISILRRLPTMLLPPLSWTNHFLSPEKKQYRSWWDKVCDKFSEATRSREAFYDAFGLYLAPRLFFLFFILGYLGLFFMLARGEYFAALLLILVGILPAYHCIVSHIEYRYIVMFYAFFSFGVGYLMVIMHDTLCKRPLKRTKEW
jgi:hypothetical protein